jgi:nitroreductase
MTNDVIMRLATDRKTSRKFKPDAVSMEDVLYALEAARQAPSGSNTQPNTYIIIDSTDVKARIRAAAEQGEKKFYEGLQVERKKWYDEKGLSWRKPMFEEAPVLVVVVSDTSKPNYFASAWVAVAYIMLALEERGLADVPYTPSNPTLIAEAMRLPKGQHVITILPIGYDDDPKKKEPRKPLAEIVRYNAFDVKHDL